MGKRLKLGLALLCTVVLLCGCNPFGYQNTAELLRAPALGYGYDEIQKALGSYLGVEPRYKFPKEGEWRSPLLRADLDGDGMEEAVALYSVDDGAAVGDDKERGNYVFVAVLEQVDGAWQVVADEKGGNTDVASLEVADLLGDGTRQLIVGYSANNLSGKAFSLYTYGDERLEQLYTEYYSRYEIGDFTGRGGNDLLVVSRSDELGSLTLYYLHTRDGEFVLDEPSDPVKLDANFVSCSALVPSRGQNGERLVLVDGVNASEDGALATQIVYYSEGRFYTIDDAGALRGATARVNQLLLTRDIDGDGVAEVPVRDGRQEIQTPAADKRMEYVRWVDFVTDPANPQDKVFGILDSDRTVFISLPVEWRGQITVVDGDEKGEWHIQSRRTLANLLSLRIMEAGETPSVGAAKVPGTTATYLIVQRGVPEAERNAIKMTNMA